jgi:hypothetical protein
MANINNKPPMMASREFVAVIGALSKAALIDALWCACQLGTNETAEEILTQAARNALAACTARHDRVFPALRELADKTIDSDGD